MSLDRSHHSNPYMNTCAQYSMVWSGLGSRRLVTPAYIHSRPRREPNQADMNSRKRPLCHTPEGKQAGDRTEKPDGARTKKGSKFHSKSALKRGKHRS